MKVSLCGLGKLGLCLAACIADSGIDVIGIDIEKKIVASVNSGIAPWYEPGLQKLLDKVADHGLIATTQHKLAIEETDLTIILVATPSMPDGSFSNRFIESVLETLGAILADSTKLNHTFVISSTVMPGSIEKFVGIIERSSKRKLNEGFTICYDPDFVALGNVIEGFRRPDMLVIGESKSGAGDLLINLHMGFWNAAPENYPLIARMSIVDSELAKVCLNAYVTMKISFANFLGMMCERIPTANAHAIANAIGADKRISPHYFRPGLSFGGTCFPRDVKAFTTVAETYGMDTALIDAVSQINISRQSLLSDIVMMHVESRRIGILGTAFTANTPVITESPAIHLIEDLLRYDCDVFVYDRFALDVTRQLLGSAVNYCGSVNDCIENVDMVVLMHRDRSLVEELKQTLKEKKDLIIIDCWDICNFDIPNIRIVKLGQYQE